MAQIEPYPRTDFDKTAPGEYHPSSLPPHSAQTKLKWPNGRGAKGISTMRVQELLPKARDRLVTIGANAPLTEAAEFLFEPTCRMIVVCDPAGVMTGVITRTDIIRQIRHCQGCACDARCTTIMTTQVISCRPDDRLDEIWTVMSEKALQSVPVIDFARRPIGLLSARDALEVLLASIEYEDGLLKDYVMGVGYR